RQHAAELQNHTGSDRFIAPPGVGMEDHESGKRIETRWWIASGNRKPQILAQGCAECLSQLEIAIDGVLLPVHSRYLRVKKTRTFARIAHSQNCFCTANPGDERAAEQALEIQRHIRSQLARFPNPRQ